MINSRSSPQNNCTCELHPSDQISYVKINQDISSYNNHFYPNWSAIPEM